MVIIAGNAFMQHATFDCHEVVVIECPTQEILAAFTLGGTIHTASLVLMMLGGALFVHYVVLWDCIIRTQRVWSNAPPWFAWDPLFQRLFSQGILHPRQYA